MRLRKRKMKGNLYVGKPDVDPTSPSHVRGVRQGNAKGNLEHERGIKPIENGARGTARRSTGIRPRKHGPVLPLGLMPNLSPA